MDSHTQNRKSNKTVILASLAVLAVIAALVGAVLLTRTNANGASQPASIGIKAARVLPQDGTCLANNAAIKAKVHALPMLSEDGGFWTSYIYDVPAGVNVEDSIATYNGTDTVTGSLAYSDNYGSYNFTATKQANEWRYTKFARCQ